jgi:hypothetical protein
MTFDEAKVILAAFESEELDLDGIRMVVTTPRTLYRMKRDTVRPRDAVDAAWIRETFGIEDE